MSEYQNSKYQIRLPLVLCLGLAAGVFVGASLSNKKGSGDVGKDVQKFRDVLTQIQTEYVDTVNTSELVDDAIQHMLNKLDPHSAYIPAAERIAANEIYGETLMASGSSLIFSMIPSLSSRR